MVALKSPRQRPVGTDPYHWKNVLDVVKHDFLGPRDVQDAPTPSYVWLGEQIGLIALGFFAAIAFGWGWGASFGGEGGSLMAILALFAGLAVFGTFGYQKYLDYQAARTRWAAVFPFSDWDRYLAVGTPVLFFLVGVVLGWGVFGGFGRFLIALIVAGAAAAGTAYWWLRKKIAFQQAGLPFGYRLAAFDLTLQDNDVTAIGGFTRPAETAPAFRHLVVTGPTGPGKTNLAVGIGTEFANQLGKGRYVGLSDLLHLVGAPAAPSGLLDYDDGRALWPLTEAELLIVDDVDAGLDTKALLSPEGLESALTALKGQKPLGWLAARRSVWVLGEGSSPEGWQVTLARLIGTDARTIRTVRLPLTVPAPAELEHMSG
jgi:hypothetical protein